MTTPGHYRFAVISDPHLCPPGTPDLVWNNTVRRSVAWDIFNTAVSDVHAEDHTQALLLGDTSDFGVEDTITEAVLSLAEAGLRSWIVPGNHDVSRTPEAVRNAVKDRPDALLLESGMPRLSDDLALGGHGLLSADGGATCTATNLPSVNTVPARLLLWASHYPAKSVRSTPRKWPAISRRSAEPHRCPARRGTVSRSNSRLTRPSSYICRPSCRPRPSDRRAGGRRVATRVDRSLDRHQSAGCVGPVPAQTDHRAMVGTSRRHRAGRPRATLDPYRSGLATGRRVNSG